MPNPVNNSVLVLGAGELGTAVLDALANHPARAAASISVLLRASSIADTSAARRKQLNDLRSMDVKPVPGDLEQGSVSELAKIFAGYGTVIGCSGMAGSEGLQVKLATAALKARVRRYVPWQFGVDYETIGVGSAQGKFTEQLAVRSMLRAQTQTQWLIFSVGVFMSFVFESGFGMVDREKGIVRAFGAWDNEITATSVRDIGRIVAEVIWNGEDVWSGQAEGVSNGIVWCAGDTFDYGDLIDVMRMVLGRKVKREIIHSDDPRDDLAHLAYVVEAPGKEVRRELWSAEKLSKEQEEDPENEYKKYRAIWGVGKGVSWNKDTSFNESRHMKMETVWMWAEAHLMKLNQQ